MKAAPLGIRFHPPTSTEQAAVARPFTRVWSRSSGQQRGHRHRYLFSTVLNAACEHGVCGQAVSRLASAGRGFGQRCLCCLCCLFSARAGQSPVAGDGRTPGRSRVPKQTPLGEVVAMRTCVH